MNHDSYLALPRNPCRTTHLRTIADETATQPRHRHTRPPETPPYTISPKRSTPPPWPTYSATQPKIMNIHAARAAVPMATYPALKHEKPLETGQRAAALDL